MTVARENTGTCSLADPRVRAVLDRLHRAANRQPVALARYVVTVVGDRIRRRQPAVAEEVERLKHLYVPVTRKQGQLLYLVARSLGAKRIVEFGTSFGISTTYLAAAVRDNGGGVVIGTELEPGKVAAARRSLEDAGLGDLVEIREGDARETLRDLGKPVDLVLLDSVLALYLPVLEMLTPSLRPGAAVLAVNVLTFRLALAPYIAHVRDPANGFSSMTLFVGDGVEYSIRL